MHNVCPSEFFVNSFGSATSRKLAAEGGMTLPNDTLNLQGRRDKASPFSTLYMGANAGKEMLEIRVAGYRRG